MRQTSGSKPETVGPPSERSPQYYLSRATGLTLTTAQGSVVWPPARLPRREAGVALAKCLLAAFMRLSRVICRVPDSVCFPSRADRSTASAVCGGGARVGACFPEGLSRQESRAGPEGCVGPF